MVAGGKLPSEGIAANPAYTLTGSIEAREGFGLLALSRGFVCSTEGSPAGGLLYAFGGRNRKDVHMRRPLLAK